MKSTVNIPKNAYEELLKKAQLVELFRGIFREDYPIEDYSDKRIKEFEKADRISPALRKSITFFLKKRG